MKYCTNCGHEIHDEAIMCVHCNTPVEKPKPQKVEPPVKVEEPFVEGTPSKGWMVLGIFLPVVALILFFICRRKRPQRARLLKKGMIIGFIIYAVSYLLNFLTSLVRYAIGIIFSSAATGISAILGGVFDSFFEALFDSLEESIESNIPAAFIHSIGFLR